MISQDGNYPLPYGTNPLHPLPSNTFATAYEATPRTILGIVNASDPEEVELTSSLIGVQTYISILPTKSFPEEKSDISVEIVVSGDGEPERVRYVVPDPIPSGQLVYANMPLYLVYDNPDGIENLLTYTVGPSVSGAE